MTRISSYRHILITGALVLTFWVFNGCSDTTAMSEDDQIYSAITGVAREGEDNVSRARTASDDATEWPEGWMIVHHEEWIPVLDELGRRLHEARRAFLSGDRGTTVDNIRRGVDYLEAQFADSGERDRAAITTAVSILREIMSRLADEEEVTLAQLDIAFANAYFSDLEREALVVQTGSQVPYHKLPDSHLQLAIERFLANDSENAATEIDRASAYLYLEGNRLGLSERAELNKAAQNLERLAARLRILKIRDRAELERVFKPASRTWHQHAITSKKSRTPTFLVNPGHSAEE